MLIEIDWANQLALPIEVGPWNEGGDEDKAIDSVSPENALAWS